jgi:hypothetical protein
LLRELVVLLRETQSRIQMRGNSITTRCYLRSRWKRLATITAGRSLLACGRPRCYNALSRKYMLVSSSSARRSGDSSSGGIGSRDKREATRIRAIRILILARTPTPVETDGIIACFARLDTVLTRRLLLTALDLARLARPTSCATALLRLSGALFLRSRHPCCTRRLFLSSFWGSFSFRSDPAPTACPVCPVSCDASPGPAWGRHDRIADKSISLRPLISVSRASLLLVGQGRLPATNGAERCGVEMCGE